MDSSKYPDGTWAKGYVDGWNSVPGSGPAPDILPSAGGPVTSDDLTRYEDGYAVGRKVAADK